MATQTATQRRATANKAAATLDEFGNRAQRVFYIQVGAVAAARDAFMRGITCARARPRIADPAEHM